MHPPSSLRWLLAGAALSIATPAVAVVPRVDFETGIAYELGNAPVVAFGGDCDGDGDPDVLVIERDGVQVHLGDGQGRLSVTPILSPPALGGSPRQGAVLDATEDGILDVVIYLTSPRRLAVMRGEGDGRFTEIVSVALTQDPAEIAVADFDADSHLDLALAMPEGVRLLLGDGAGGFPRTFLNTYSPPRTPSSIAAADVDEDGNVDWGVATPVDTAVKIGFGDGAGGVLRTTSQTVAAEASRLVLADLDGDGHVDAAVGGTYPSRFLAILRGDGTGALALAHLAWPEMFALGIAVADLDGDALPELIVQHDNGRGLVIGRADAPFEFEPVQRLVSISGFYRPVIGDYDGDGDADVVAVTPSSLILLRGRGDATLVAPRQTFFEDIVRGLAAVDVDGDGALDVVATRYDASDVIRMFGDGAGGLGPISALHYNFKPERVVPTDFDLNGVVDLVVVGQGRVALARGHGTHFEGLAKLPFTSGEDLAVADVDGDGKDDVVTVSGGRYLVYLGTGGAAYSAAIESTTGTNAESMALADFNGDGVLDAAIGKSAGTYDVMASRGRGDGTFVGAFAYSNFEPNTNVFAGDFDADGAVDLAAYFSESSGAVDAVRVFWGGGDMGFSVPTSFAPGVAPRSIRAADVDGDGTPEIVTTSDRRRLDVFFENGSRGFETTELEGFFDASHAAAAGDFDGDGSTDFATSGSHSISIVLNRTADLPENAVRRGNVNAAAGPVTDVLFVNGRKGLGDARRMRVDPDEFFQIRMKAPPALGDGPAEYALFAWVGTAGPTSIEPAPGGYGPLGMPFASVRRRWNNTGDPIFGAPDFPSTPATATVMRRPNGLRKRLTAYLQGVIEDPASPSGVYAVTNGIEVVSR